MGKNPTQVENNWTDSIDQWRKKMGLDKIVLIGHSMGGYLAAVYLMRYPQERFLMPTVAFVPEISNTIFGPKHYFSGKL